MKKLDMIYVLAACAVVSACGPGGGGGVNSTPPPSPPPVTPPPSPPPPPPPTTANADLLSLTQSESFTNDAATGSASYPKSGTSPGTTSATKSTVSVIYDATSRTYTVTSGSRSQAFAQATRDSALSSPKQDVYKIVTGNITDTLTLNKPGTSGTLTYKYVGAGYWQRTIDGTSTISASIDAFTYGVETPDAVLRRTGAARFDVDLQGVSAYLDGPTSLLGAGEIEVDFETFKMKTYGSYSEYLADGSLFGPGYFEGNATLSSSTNKFSGQIFVGANFPSNVSSWDGRFYGPDSKEVGSTFSVLRPDGVSTVGTIIGRWKADIPSTATNTSLVNLTKSTSFANNGAYYGTMMGSGGAGSGSFVSFSYNADTQSYSYGPEGGAFFSPTFRPADISASLSDGKYTTYQIADGGATHTLKLYKPAGSNTEFQLSHIGFGQYSMKTGSTTNQQRFFVYRLGDFAGGQVAVPRTGTANYFARIYGAAIEPTKSTLDLGGDAAFNFDFATAKFTGSMNPLGTDPVTGATRNWGSFTFSNGALFGGSNQFNGQIMSGTNYAGQTYGWLMGPTANELGASFYIGPLNVGDIGNQWSLVGVMLGKTCPSATPC